MEGDLKYSMGPLPILNVYLIRAHPRFGGGNKGEERVERSELEGRRPVRGERRQEQGLPLRNYEGEGGGGGV